MAVCEPRTASAVAGQKWLTPEYASAASIGPALPAGDQGRSTTAEADIGGLRRPHGSGGRCPDPAQDQGAKVRLLVLLTLPALVMIVRRTVTGLPFSAKA